MKSLGYLALRLAYYVGVQVLRAGEDVKSEEIQIRGFDIREHGGHQLGIHAELLRAAAHAHPRPLDLEIGVHAQSNTRTHAQSFADDRDTGSLARGFKFNHHATGHGARQFGVCLAGPREADLRGRHDSVENDVHFEGGCDIETINQGRQMLNDRGHGVRLRRVAQVDIARQLRAQLPDARGQQGSVVGEIRRRAAARCEPLDIMAPEHQVPVLDSEGCDCGMRHWHVSCSRNNARSNFPFGETGMTSISMIREGTMYCGRFSRISASS